MANQNSYTRSRAAAGSAGPAYPTYPSPHTQTNHPPTQQLSTPSTSNPYSTSAMSQQYPPHFTPPSYPSSYDQQTHTTAVMHQPYTAPTTQGYQAKYARAQTAAPNSALANNGPSADQPPPILGQLDPPIGHKHTPKPGHVKDATGRSVCHANGLVLKAFPGLPDSFPQEPEMWQVEALFRQYPSFSYDDIVARLPPETPKWSKKEKNAFNNRRMREARKRYNARDWSGRHGKLPSRTIVEFVFALTPEQIRLNTAWVVTPGGIHPPNLPRALLPLDYYIRQNGGHDHTPSEEVTAAQVLIRELNTRAAAQGKADWTTLDKADLPREWYSRAKPAGGAAGGNGTPGAPKRKWEDEGDGGSIISSTQVSPAMQGGYGARGGHQAQGGFNLPPAYGSQTGIASIFPAAQPAATRNHLPPACAAPADQGYLPAGRFTSTGTANNEQQQKRPKPSTMLAAASSQKRKRGDANAHVDDLAGEIQYPATDGQGYMIRPEGNVNKRPRDCNTSPISRRQQVSRRCPQAKAVASQRPPIKQEPVVHQPLSTIAPLPPLPPAPGNGYGIKMEKGVDAETEATLLELQMQMFSQHQKRHPEGPWAAQPELGSSSSNPMVIEDEPEETGLEAIARWNESFDTAEQEPVNEEHNFPDFDDLVAQGDVNPNAPQQGASSSDFFQECEKAYATKGGDDDFWRDFDAGKFRYEPETAAESGQQYADGHNPLLKKAQADSLNLADSQLGAEVQQHSNLDLSLDDHQNIQEWIDEQDQRERQAQEQLKKRKGKGKAAENTTQDKSNDDWSAEDYADMEADFNEAFDASSDVDALGEDDIPDMPEPDHELDRMAAQTGIEIDRLAAEAGVRVEDPFTAEELAEFGGVLNGSLDNPAAGSLTDPENKVNSETVDDDADLNSLFDDPADEDLSEEIPVLPQLPVTKPAPRQATPIAESSAMAAARAHVARDRAEKLHLPQMPSNDEDGDWWGTPKWF